MARPLRIEFEGALYHVIARGNTRANIFLDDHDRQAFIKNLGQACDRYCWRIWAWCLLSNHYHLLVETLEPSLSRGMREVNGVYSQAFNRRHGRSGHVFEGRYKAVLVEKDSHLLELSRYIVLNSVRAGMVEAAGDWAWSSYRSIMGKAAIPEWLAVDETLSLFHRQRGPARRAYTRFVAEGIGRPDPSADSPRAGFIGSEAFVEKVQSKIDLANLSSEISRKSRPAPSLEAIESGSRDRNEAIRKADATGAYTLTEVARHFGIHVSTASRIARQHPGAKNKT